MPRYKVIVECSGPHGNAALTYRINAASQFAAEFRACQLAGDRYPEYRDIKPVRTEVLKNGGVAQSAGVDFLHGERKSSQLIRSSQCCRPRGLNFVV